MKLRGNGMLWQMKMRYLVSEVFCDNKIITMVNIQILSVIIKNKRNLLLRLFFMMV